MADPKMLTDDELQASFRRLLSWMEYVQPDAPRNAQNIYEHECAHGGGDEFYDVRAMQSHISAQAAVIGRLRKVAETLTRYDMIGGRCLRCDDGGFLLRDEVVKGLASNG
jgi:hypothetical protein